jgi:predicted HicB family RNase H-like nuclease
MSKTSEAMRKAINKYQTEKVDEFKIRVPKGQKQVIQDFAKSKGKSLNAFVYELIQREIEKG